MIDLSEVTPPQYRNQGQTANYYVEEGKTQNASLRRLVIILIIVIIVAAGCVVGALLIHKKSGDDSQNSVASDNSTEVEQQVTEPTRSNVLAETGTTRKEVQPTMRENQVNDAYGHYVLPGSDSRYLSRGDISYLNKAELRLARNEIYARHGRLFDDESLQAYFDSQSWYYGTVLSSEFSESWLNDYEAENVRLIRAYEKEMGYR